MIKIQNAYQSNNILNTSILTGEQKEILDLMVKYEEVYSYEHFNHLKFELDLRIEIVKAATALYQSGVKFTTFEHSRCNPALWNLTSQGAIVIKPGVPPSEGIRDLYANGKLYAFECATAIVAVFYKAVLEIIEERHFNRLFAGMILYDWHYDDDLGVFTRRGNDYLPGDCVYFKNPDFDPEKPQWRGENTIDMGYDLYYGHGIGIKDAEGIIASLNKYRKKGAVQTAYLLSQVTRLDYRYLYVYRKAGREIQGTFPLADDQKIISKIGSAVYLK
ncbi:protein-glutamine gamma-glutamyltransferase [Metabacillus dongyingensis]|uniref:protein-glutamine gamma-glutamyltransferase n=1 Tax=Metabacillus dongyingensis TaxID=2874282 RepID=UPI003B8ACA96